MKTTIITLATLLLGASCAYSQDINQSEVPAIVVNAFQQKFANAADIDWELKADQYNVEFEIGNADHEAWYDNTGKLIRHDEEIKKEELPAAVLASIKKDYDGFRVSDVERKTNNNTTTYKVELDKLTEEWKVTYSESGEIIDKIAD